PETGATLPGMTVVCGDSHTSTHGAFGCLAFGIGTSEVEHVLATQCLLTRQSKAMRVSVNGTLPFGCTAKDIALAIIGKIGTAGGTGYAIEYDGRAIRALSIEGRVPDPEKEKDPILREGIERALIYMGLEPNTAMTNIKIDKVFIGSCTNSRIEDLRAAAAVVNGRRKAGNVKLAMVVPGSGL